ncbi:MAG: hypothetical protein AB1345_04100 [Chloroflexota bacterium]
MVQILLADDEKSITDYLAPMLERAGFGVTVWRDGRTALEQIINLYGGAFPMQGNPQHI